MKERFAALPTLLLVLAGVFQATRGLGGDEAASETGSAAASKLAQAERVVVYGLTTTGGPRFRMPAGAGVVQLIVHLELPRVLSSLSPGASYAFTVQATLRGLDLSAAELSGIDLSGADLRGSDLSALDPRDATLAGAQVDVTQAVVLVTTLGLLVGPDAPG